jgi:hypothetical protein
MVQRVLILATMLSLSATTAKAQHTVILKSGEKLKGVVLEISGDEMQMAINRQMSKIHMREVSSIFFNEYVPYDGSFDPGEEEKTVRAGDYLVRYIVKDREIIKPPKISNATENRGVVVVDIAVDRYGNVTSSKAGGVGSTTTNEYLYTKAEFACRGIRFNEYLKGPISTKGQIILTY